MQKAPFQGENITRIYKNRNGICIANAKLDFISYMSCEVEEGEHNRGMQYAN